jgi:hypothetical protein
MMRKHFMFSILTFLLVSLVTLAQVPTGAIVGTVLDPNGLAIHQAEVTLVRQGTTAEYKTTTSETGAFRFGSLPAGVYRIRITFAGFKVYEFSDIKLDAGTEYTLPPVRLELGDVTETVTVEAGAVGVRTTDAQVTDVVEPQQIKVLPLGNRNPLVLLGLQATVNSNARTVTVIAGQRPSLSNVTMDGVNVQDNFIRANSLNFLPNLPLLSQVAEFTVTTSNQSVAQGFGASQVSMVTPSGGSSWQFEGFWFHRNNALAANSWFNNATGIEKPNLIFNQGGVNGGGPLLHNKLLIYGYYEFFRQRQQGAQNHVVLTEPARQGIFTYRATCTTACPAGITPGQVLQQNIFTALAARGINLGIDPFIADILSMVPTDINNFLTGDSNASQLFNTPAFFSINGPTGRGTTTASGWTTSPTPSMLSTVPGLGTAMLWTATTWTAPSPGRRLCSMTTTKNCSRLPGAGRPLRTSRTKFAADSTWLRPPSWWMKAHVRISWSPGTCLRTRS